MAPTYTMSFAGSAGEKAELGKNVMRSPCEKGHNNCLKDN